MGLAYSGGVHAIDIGRAADRIEREVVRDYVRVTGVHRVMEVQNNPEFKAILNRSLLTVPDGMPTVRMWIEGLKSMQPVFGPDLMVEVRARWVQKRCTHFLYGVHPA